MGWFHEGGGVAGTGETPAMVQGGEAIVPIQRTPAAENLATMVAEKSSDGGGNNTAVVAAVQALGTKLDAVVSALSNSGDFVMQIDERAFGRVVNKQIGEAGYQKIDIRSA
jgi:ribosomal protein S11